VRTVSLEARVLAMLVGLAIVITALSLRGGFLSIVTFLTAATQL